jgi:hypothetical protein
MISWTSRSSIPWLLHTFILQPAPLAMQRDPDKRRDYFADHSCPGYAFRAICLETLGRFSPSAVERNALQSHSRRLPPARTSACHLLRQSVLPAVRGVVQSPVSHAYHCSGPPHRAQGFRLDRRCAAALSGGSALGVRVQPRVLLESGNVLVLVVRCLLL